MKNIFLKLVLTSIIISSCQNQDAKSKNSIDIILLNSEIHSLSKNEFKQGDNWITDEEEIKEKNFIKFKVINNSEQRQLIVFNQFMPLFGNLESRVHSKENKLRQFTNLMLHNYDNESDSLFGCILAVQKEDYKYYDEFDIKDISTYVDYQNNNIILNAHEAITFTTVIYMPFITKKSFKAYSGNHSMYEDLQNGDLFSLIYKADVKKYEKSLPDWELKDLKKRGINFYKDSIVSNSVPIKLVR